MTPIPQALPPRLVCYKRTPLFTRASVPEALLSAHSVPPSGWHNVYVALEGLKLLLILAAAIVSTRWTLAGAGSAQ
jgi:tellurite resistance-related uncharacterized protein